MTVAALEYNGLEVRDHEELRAFLTQDPVANAYLLGDLDPLYAPYCTWYGSRDAEGNLGALLLLYMGLRLPAVLTVAPPNAGASDALAVQRSLALLDELFAEVRPKLPRQFWVHAWEHHQPYLDRYFLASDLKRMIRMALRREDYRPHPGHAPVRRLGHVDTAPIMELYSTSPDHFFEPYQLESGLYFGVDSEEQDRLAAIAGIHVHSEAYDIAAIGNLVTHPKLRRRGYATAATTVLLNELFKTVSLVTLNVEEANVAAIKTFEKFGFQCHHVYFEGCVETRR